MDTSKMNLPWDMAVLVNDIDAVVEQLEALHIGPFLEDVPREGGDGLFFQGQPLDSERRTRIGWLGRMHVELIQPDDKPNPWKEFLKARGDGIHHLGFQVEDVGKEVERLISLGAEVPFCGNIDGKLGAAYVDLKVANLFIELTSFQDTGYGSPTGANYDLPWDVAVLVHDVDTVVRRLEAYGFGPFIQPGAPAGGEGLFFQGQPLVSDSRALVGRMGGMHLELIQPDDKPNPWREFLQTKGEGIHHIGFQVEDVEREIECLIDLGAEVPFYGKVNGKTGAAYVDLKAANLFIELTSFMSIPQ